MTILITNDDGYKSWGINVLYRAAKRVFGGDVVVVAPDKYQSSTGMSFTFHKPLRIDSIVHEKMPCLAVSGTPSDCVFMAIHHLFKNKISMVLSGANIGMNAGLDAVYSSGTVSAALCAAIFRIPSIAFSKDVGDSIDADKKEMDKIYSRLVFLLNKIKKNGFPRDVELLNINFPRSISKNTSIKVVRMDKNVFDDAVQKKTDPHGREYYWLYGTLKKDLDKTADLSTLLSGHITVTPVRLAASDEPQMSSVKSIFYDAED